MDVLKNVLFLSLRKMYQIMGFYLVSIFRNIEGVRFTQPAITCSEATI